MSSGKRMRRMLNLFGVAVDPSAVSGILSSSLGIFYRLRIGMKMCWYEWVLSLSILFFLGGVIFVATESSFEEGQVGLRAFFSGCAAFTLTEVLAVTIDAVRDMMPNIVKRMVSKK